MNELTDKIKDLLKDRRIWVWAGAALFFVFVIVFSSKNSPKKADIVDGRTKQSLFQKTAQKEGTGLFLSEDVDRKAFVGRLEEQYHHVQEKNQQMELRVAAMDKKFSDLAKSQDFINESLLGLETKIAESMAKTDTASEGNASGQGTTLSEYRMEVVSINPVAEAEPEGVFLPPGSFVRGTLLTGVYAPADQNNPLPVLIRLNEAFYGPNEARIPLSGAFVIGKASGELNSERALIQAVTLATVMPEGKEFHHQGNIGYITDVHGELGIRGVVVRNTGAQMATSFMTGFLGGASQAVADGETTAVTTSSGRVSRNVTGNVGRHAAFQGLSQSAAQLSKYYADQLNAIVPAVRVEAGIDVYLIILEGVKVNGLKIDKTAVSRYLD